MHFCRTENGPAMYPFALPATNRQAMAKLNDWLKFAG
jgi:hypothetical protein